MLFLLPGLYSIFWNLTISPNNLNFQEAFLDDPVLNDPSFAKFLLNVSCETYFKTESYQKYK